MFKEMPTSTPSPRLIWRVVIGFCCTLGGVIGIIQAPHSVFFWLWTPISAVLLASWFRELIRGGEDPPANVEPPNGQERVKHG